MPRTKRALVGYASRYGSTREIALRIADTMRADDIEVDVRCVEDISDVSPYDAIVFGSGVYDGAWTAEATHLVLGYAPQLKRRLVWLFSVASFDDRHPVVGGLMRQEPRDIEQFEPIVHPRGYRVFAGVIDLERWPSWARLIFEALGGRPGDNRQWNEIEAWARDIAQQVRALD